MSWLLTSHIPPYARYLCLSLRAVYGLARSEATSVLDRNTRRVLAAVDEFHSLQHKQ